MRAKNARFLSVAAALSISTLALAGCTGGSDEPAPVASSAAPAPAAETSAPTEATTEAPAAAEAPAGDLTAPGTTINAGDWATYEFVNYDGDSAVLQARVTGMNAATEAQAAYLLEQLPETKGYAYTFITVEQRRVSGDDIAFGSDSTDFKAASTTGERAQEISVIGWDECDNNPFSQAFSDGTETITQCYVGASIEGGDPIGGLIYAGPMAADPNPYSEYDGKPIFLKG